MLKKIFGFLLIIFAAILFLAFFANRKIATENAQNQSGSGTTTQEIIGQELQTSPSLSSSDLPSPTLPLSNDPKDIAWNLFQKYLSYNKNQDLNGVKSVVYKISDVCNTKEPTQDCKNRMFSAYSLGKDLKKENFKVWDDQKQIILSTNFWQEESTSTGTFARFRSIIFFVKMQSGDWKLLSFSPLKGAAADQGQASIQEIRDRLVTYTEDKDQDGMADYIEQCLDQDTKNTCKKTDPTKRDTNGDGWWDGVEALMQ